MAGPDSRSKYAPSLVGAERVTGRVYQIPLDAARRSCYPSGMRLRASLIPLLVAAVAAAADAPAKPVYIELPPGRYAIAVRGMVCNVCARAVVARWLRIPEVEKAEIDFDRERAVVTVRLNSRLAVAKLRKALKPAAGLANMGVRFELGDVEYLP
jgi:hypothetical protein